MGRGRNKKPRNDSRNPGRQRPCLDGFSEVDMDDEIDAFHKQRDVVPLDVNGDPCVSDEDTEQPVFDFQDFNDTDDELQLTGLAAKIARQEKALRLKFGGVEDDMHDDADEGEERKAVWGKNKNLYYNADNVDYELQSSDEDDLAEEEAAVLKLRSEEVKTKEDFGLDESDQDESGTDSDEQDALAGERPTTKLDVDDTDMAYEVVKKDLDSLSKEEQMEVVYSAAAELVGLLSELNRAHSLLENEMNPLLCKVKAKSCANKEGIRYLEVKQFLLLTYCQAIVFYLLLKSEGLPVLDHPVIARLVELKNFLDKMNRIGESLPSQVEEILNENQSNGPGVELVTEGAFSELEPNSKLSADMVISREGHETRQFVNVGSSKDHEGSSVKHLKIDPVSLESMEMLKVRARLEEKLKEKAIYSSITSQPDRTHKHLVQPINRQLETLDDFDDEVVDTELLGRKASTECMGAVRPRKLTQLVAEAGKKFKKPKLVSGDDDLPARDDIGERRRKFERQGLGSSEPQPMDLNGVKDGKTEGSEDEFYKEVKQQRTAKLAAKEEIYSRSSTVQPSEEKEFGGRRQISYQMEKNKGLTRSRKKLIKIPRKKYKLKHQKVMVQRKGQVREIRRPMGPYGGETSGINTNISRSIRFGK